MPAVDTFWLLLRAGQWDALTALLVTAPGQGPAQVNGYLPQMVGREVPAPVAVIRCVMAQNPSQEDRDLALIEAARRGHLDALDVLLPGAVPGSRAVNQATAAAALHGHEEALDRLWRKADLPSVQDLLRTLNTPAWDAIDRLGVRLPLVTQQQWLQAHREHLPQTAVAADRGRLTWARSKRPHP